MISVDQSYTRRELLGALRRGDKAAEAWVREHVALQALGAKSSEINGWLAADLAAAVRSGRARFAHYLVKLGARLDNQNTNLLEQAVFSRNEALLRAFLETKSCRIEHITDACAASVVQKDGALFALLLSELNSQANYSEILRIATVVRDAAKLDAVLQKARKHENLTAAEVIAAAQQADRKAFQSWYDGRVAR